MAILPILTYPDPLLKQVCEPITLPDQSVDQLIADLLETMYESPGCVGIAAPQTGNLRRLILIDASRHPKDFPNHGQLILINPVIESQEGEVVAREGCLSIPHLTANVKRADRIRFRALQPDGSIIEISTEGFEARVVLHEYDHLDGLLFLDRVASLKTDVFRRKRYAPAKESSESDQPQAE